MRRTPDGLRPHREAALAGGLAMVVAAMAACVDDSGNGAGNPGQGGASGSAGAAGGSAGGTGGGTAGGGGGAFTVVAPCGTEAAYTQGTSASTITFGAVADISYTPKCLKVPTGAQVTFMGDFAAHPLSPSGQRGTLTGNPISATGAGTTASFTFPTPGYYAYFCTVHGLSDGGAGMVGVIWVQ